MARKEFRNEKELEEYLCKIKTDSKKETDFYNTIVHYNLPIMIMELSRERLVIYK